MYPPDELPQVEAAEAAYAEVQARLEAVPQLSRVRGRRAWGQPSLPSQLRAQHGRLRRRLPPV